MYCHKLLYRQQTRAQLFLLCFKNKLSVILNQSKMYCSWIKFKHSYLQKCFAMSPWPKERLEFIFKLCDWPPIILISRLTGKIPDIKDQI